MSYDLTKVLFVTTTTATYVITHVPMFHYSHVVYADTLLQRSVLSGLILSFSLFPMPVILENPSEANALRQWRSVYKRGANTAPPFAVTAALSAFVAAYTHYHPQALYRTWLFAASGVTTLSIIPYTLGIMLPTNRALEAKEDAASAKSQKDSDTNGVTEETADLIQKWRRFNMFRGLLPLVGSLLAFEAL